MAHKFTLNRESLKRQFAVYVVIGKGRNDTMLYVGKTGDNRDGCNPVISRCGNHFSYNRIHSQVRNEFPDHEDREYTYVFDHFDEYTEDEEQKNVAKARINEMERWLNREIQGLIKGMDHIELLHPLLDVGHVSEATRKERSAFHVTDAEDKIAGIVQEVRRELRRAKR